MKTKIILMFSLSMIFASTEAPVNAQGVFTNGKTASQHAVDCPKHSVHTGSTGPTKPGPKEIFGKGKIKPESENATDKDLIEYFPIAFACDDKDIPEEKRFYREVNPDYWGKEDVRFNSNLKPKYDLENCDCPCHRHQRRDWWIAPDDENEKWFGEKSPRQILY